MLDETCQAVRLAVQKLPSRSREVVVLHYLDGIGIDEIATILGLSRNAVEVRLHRARNRLRHLLAEFMEA